MQKYFLLLLVLALALSANAQSNYGVIKEQLLIRSICRWWWFVVRISPYTQGDRQVTGTVLTFTNVTAFRSSIDRAIYERECTKAILNAVAEPLVVLRKLIGDVYGWQRTMARGATFAFSIPCRRKSLACAETRVNETDPLAQTA